METPIPESQHNDTTDKRTYNKNQNNPRWQQKKAQKTNLSSSESNESNSRSADELTSKKSTSDSEDNSQISYKPPIALKTKRKYTKHTQPQVKKTTRSGRIITPHTRYT